MSVGNIARVLGEVERRRTAFAVARLIMLTGASLRSYTETTEDDPAVLERLLAVLSSVLDPAEIDEVKANLQ